MGSFHSVLVTLPMLVIILVSILGNLLVVLSVLLVRALRKPSNILLLALAVTDLLVSLIVMPGAVLQQLIPPTSPCCIAWVFTDVFLCTSSILCLTAICIDRYLAISSPLRYIPIRTNRLIGGLIACVTVTAGLVSAPVVPAWSVDWAAKGNTTDQILPKEALCQVPQSPAYQIYATIVAFYLPLSVILILNAKIYITARRIITKERQSPGFQQQYLVTSQFMARRSSLKSEKRLSPVPTCLCSNNMEVVETKGTEVQPPVVIRLEGELVDGDVDGSVPLFHSVSLLDACHVRKISETSYCIRLSQKCPDPRITLPPELRVSEVEDKQDLVEGDIGEGVRGGGGGGGDLPGGGERKTTSSQEHLLALRKESETSFLQLGTSGRISKSPSTRLSKYLTGSYARQEWKATLTVGLVVLTFLICWLPFFVLALVIPLIGAVPGWLSTFTLWLGYANSMLNPVIYGVLHREFRKTFLELLSCSAFRRLCGTDKFPF